MARRLYIMANVACNRHSRRRPATPYSGVSSHHRDAIRILQHSRASTSLAPSTCDLSSCSLRSQTPRGRRPRLGVSSFNTTPIRLSSSQGSLESTSSSNSSSNPVPFLCATISLSATGLSLPEDAPPAAPSCPPLRRVPRTGTCRRPQPYRPSPYSATSVSLASSQLSDMAPDEHRCVATPSCVICVSELPANTADDRIRAWLSDSPRHSSTNPLSCFGRRRRHPSDDVESSAAVMQSVQCKKLKSKRMAAARKRTITRRVLRFMGIVEMAD
ncbi:hypothetical protein CAPTEDRAFT_192106 [Capitella teleta]|uniref:Uncharacterized protein n=1 Tax=Capitella teleta TaxID=283909 RepID=R7TQY5_CAPTE|nr:hypothetical protein CAPTEDRAFT_192106 [Capitella teleta]|eukprot:ELT96298.1 hypothetical protein CAPTEDRAFT_192106 [Capitella teleta]